MKFKKQNIKVDYFFVQNYNKEERDFFLSIGFTERGDTLSFHGSSFSGMWTPKEFEEIRDKVKAKFGLKKLTISVMSHFEML